MTREGATGVLQRMAGRQELDQRLVDLLLASCDEVDRLGAAAQTAAAREYKAFRDALG